MKGLRWEAALVGFVALAATLAATERTPLTWDEGDAFVRAERVAAWARAVVVGPQRLKEAFEADEVNSQTDADFNGSNGQAASDSVATARVASSGSNGSDGSDGSDGQAASDSVAAVRVASSKAPSNSTRLALLNAESRGASGTGGAETSSEAGPTDRKKRERRRFGDVERAALDYFARFEGRRALFSAKAVEAGWPHTIYREGHPAGYSIAIASGRAFTLRFLPFLSEIAAFRFGPIALFAAALAAVFYRVARNWGRSAAVLAIIGIISIPRAFGHAQLAGGDSLLISSWLLAWAFFDAALASKRGAVALGAAVGVSFCAKFSGFTIVLPLTAGTFAACWARRRVGRRGRAKIGELRDEEKKGGTKDGGTRRDGALATFGRLTLAFVVAAAIFFVANPPLWPRPFDGFETFASLNLRRDGFDIPIYFLGKFYSPTRPLPWWSGFFWVATTVPTALLAFAALGAVAPAFRKNWGNGAVGKNSELTANGEAAKASRGEDGGGAGVVGLTASRGEDGGGAGVVGLTASRDEAGGGIVVAGLTASRSVASRKEETGGGAPLGKEEETVVGAPLGKEEGAVGGRSGRRLAGLAFAFAATLPFVRVIPGIPTHDGARLLIASFPFVAI
ncbi:MAG: hypothetical protein IKW13_03840, partial [Thermoguttaceae bacterium]|nr:hypothetical protein [Thermoguttaceae bacterium]